MGNELAVEISDPYTEDKTARDHTLLLLAHRYPIHSRSGVYSGGLSVIQGKKKFLIYVPEKVVMGGYYIEHGDIIPTEPELEIHRSNDMLSWVKKGIEDGLLEIVKEMPISEKQLRVLVTTNLAYCHAQINLREKKDRCARATNNILAAMDLFN